MTDLKIDAACNEDRLLGYGFKKCGTDYKMSVPLYTYKQYVVIYGWFHADINNRSMRIEVVNENGTLYTAFYDKELSNYKHNKVVHVITKKINTCLNDMHSHHIIQEVR